MGAQLNRRLFLRGVGGVVLAAPMLHTLGRRAAVAQDSLGASPKRLILMFTHYGCLTDRWFPATAHGTLKPDDYKGLSIEALAPHASKLLMPRGIRAMNEWTPDLSRGQGVDPHQQVVGSYFTCQPVYPNSDDPFGLTQSPRFPSRPVGPSLDHVCAQQLSPGQVPMLLRVGGSNDTAQSAISYSAAEVQFSGIGTLNQAYAAVSFPSSPEALGVSTTYQELRKQRVLDLVRDDLTTLRSRTTSASDKHKLEAWETLLQETAQAVAAHQCSEELAITSLGLTEANLGRPASDPAQKVENTSLVEADIWSNLAVLAAVCNANPIIVLKFPGLMTSAGLGLTTDAHGISHRVGSHDFGGDCVTDANEQIEKIDRFYATRFAHLVATLDGISEGEETLLDNTATVWFQEMSDGVAHNLNNLPIIQAGSCGGYFKTGQAINVDNGDADLSRGTSSALCAEGGAFAFSEIANAGTDPSLANAPINKYFCNLMNAIGVKAGDDGFPMVGGTAPVTHYGMYDKTEDFIGGGVNPPMIHSPGEFEQLRA